VILLWLAGYYGILDRDLIGVMGEDVQAVVRKVVTVIRFGGGFVIREYLLDLKFPPGGFKIGILKYFEDC
jgi:hypothetical protein